MVDESYILKNLIKSIGILVVACNFKLDKLEVIGEFPTWYQHIASHSANILTQQELFEVFPFLPIFFDMLYNKISGTGSVNPESNVWGIDSVEGEPYHFVCSMLELEDSILLTIKKLDSEFTERQLILHSKRELQLKYDEIWEKQKKIKMDIDSIVFDLNSPIEGLKESIGSIYKLMLSLGNQQSINIANRQILKLQSLIQELKSIVD